MPGTKAIIPRSYVNGVSKGLSFRNNKKRKRLANLILDNETFSFNRISEILSSIQEKPYVKGVRLKISVEYDYPVLALGEFDLKKFFNNFDEDRLFSGQVLVYENFICQPLLVREQIIGYLMVDFNRNSDKLLLVDITKSYSIIISQQLELDLKFEEIQSVQIITDQKRNRYKRWENRSRSLLNMITHDLKSPLQAIAGYLQILQKKSANHQLDLFDAKHIFNSMEYGLNDIIRMVNQINELLSYTNDHVSVNKVNVEINWLIEEVVGLMRSLADEKKRTLQFIHSAEPIYLETDIDKVKRIIENFISNAIKYTQVDGHIRVKVDKDDDEILISVIDNGLGIPQSNLKYIFEPYNNNDQLHPGSHRSIGLGLYNCSFFSRLLGGRITVESRQGKGSVFCLHHPISQNQINP